MIELAGRTAFITGGANGIGLGIAKALAESGVKVAIADVDADALAAAKKELAAKTEVETVMLDVRDRVAYAQAADKVEESLGPVSLLFNNAGVAYTVPVAKLTYDLWDWSIGINLGGVFNGVQTFLPRMVERGSGGYHANTFSSAGLAGKPSGRLFTTGKFGDAGMSGALRLGLRGTGVGFSVPCSGPVATGLSWGSAAVVRAAP